MQRPIKISTDAPLRESHTLGRRNASRVPALRWGWENLVFYLKTVCSTNCFAVADKNNCIMTIDRLQELIAFWQIDNLEHGLFTSLSCRPRSGHFFRTKSETMSVGCAEIHSNQNKESFHEGKHTNLGSSGNPKHTGSSHDILVLATAHLQRGGDQFRQHFAVTYKSNYDNINSILRDQVDRS